MLGRAKQTGIPRRVVVYYLAICLIVVAWLLVSIVLVAQSVLHTSEEGSFLAFLGRAATTTTLEMLREETPDLQSLVERFTREKALLYCAVVSPEEKYLAHTVRTRVGTHDHKLPGKRLQWGDIQATRVSDRWMGATREYRAPLEAGGESVGTLVMSARETGVLTSVKLAAEQAPYTLAAPFLFVAFGAVVLLRLVRPLEGLETQLRRAAVAPTLNDSQLQPLKSHSPSAIGWNRLIQHFKERDEAGGLQERVSEAIQTLRQGKSDDILNSLTDGLAVTGQDGRITFHNHALASLLRNQGAPTEIDGKQVEELLATYLQDAETNDEANNATDEFTRPELLNRSVIRELERETDGIPQHLRVARCPIRTAKPGTRAGHVWCLRDVTQQRLAEKTRSQFLDTATHELRTPLANIKAYAETLALSEVMDIESQKEFCNTINSEATRLARFIDDLLSISSMEVGSLALQRQNVEMERMLVEIVSKVKPQMDKKQVRLTTIFPEKYPKMDVDKDKLTIAIVNLLGNAAKYTPDGGSVTFKVQVEPTQMKIDIEDSGVGISHEELPRVFDKFFRSMNPKVQAETGTGLGLSMSQEIIRLHGGELTVQSVLGEGTTFTATLPIHTK